MKVWQKLDEDEFIEVVLAPINRLIQNAKSARMSDAAAVLLAYDKLREIQYNAKDS